MSAYRDPGQARIERSQQPIAVGRGAPNSGRDDGWQEDRLPGSPFALPAYGYREQVKRLVGFMASLTLAGALTCGCGGPGNNQRVISHPCSGPPGSGPMPHSGSTTTECGSHS